MQNTYCCQCGKPRKSYEKQTSAYLADAGVINTLDYREKIDNPNALNEGSPQLMATCHIGRNGGTDDGRTHICPECLAVAIQKLIEILERDLIEFSS